MASATAECRASLHLSRRGKRLSGQESYGSDHNPALATTRTHGAKLSWPEAVGRPSVCHIAGMSKIPWTLLSSSYWQELDQGRLRTLL